jgi:hypothetical protein
MSKKKGTLFGKPRSQVVKRPGAFRAKAKKLGLTVDEYMAKIRSGKIKVSSRTKRQAALAKTFKAMRAKKKSK